jgi:hypothetical protein
MALTSDGKLYGWGWNKVIINVHLLFFIRHIVGICVKLHKEVFYCVVLFMISKDQILKMNL